MSKHVIVVPNWNGIKSLPACLDSLLKQSVEAHIIVVDNGSRDGSVELLKRDYTNVELIEHSENKGYAGGVNPGLRRAIEMGAYCVAPFNNDAVADTDWLKGLVACLEKNPGVGMVCCKLLDASGEQLDSTGDYYTSWGLPYPRGRGEKDLTTYDGQPEVFGTSGGASLYRVAMLEAIGLLDEDFFAYYEDVDLSFRAQLAGWTARFEPKSVAYHQIGATSKTIKGFTTYQTMKNLPVLLYKNVPRRFLYRITWRFILAHTLFFLRAIQRGRGWPALKGDARGTYLLFKKTP
jgi:GT2 family glycosyltransferase